jgi:hydroxyacylglutathione hydrolase
MEVNRFVNKFFNSNTYLLYQDEENDVWVIDPGSSFNEILDWIEKKGKSLKGILLTHSHFDHICGINDLQDKFAGSIVYASLFGKEGLLSEKLNGSLYMEIPFVVKRQLINIVKEGDLIFLWNNIILKVIETPGHDRDCISFLVNENLFTGDALIPGIKVHTKLKYSNKKLAEESINRIFNEFDDKTIIWPGHEDKCLLFDLKK